MLPGIKQFDLTGRSAIITGGSKGLGEAMAAGLAAMELISAPGFYEPLFARTAQLCDGMERAAAKAGVPFTTNHAGTMFGGFFTDADTVSSYSQVMACKVPTQLNS